MCDPLELESSVRGDGRASERAPSLDSAGARVQYYLKNLVRGVSVEEELREDMRNLHRAMRDRDDLRERVRRLEQVLADHLILKAALTERADSV